MEWLIWAFNQSETGQGSIYPSLPPHEFSLCCTWLSVAGLRAGTAFFSMATATKPWEGNCARVKMLLCCSNYFTWINNQIRLRKAGKKASLLMRGKSNLNFSVPIKPAVC